jgi:hypothetical protein
MARKGGAVSPHVGKLVVDRDGQCVVRVTHPMARAGEQIHHRRPRGMGGTRVSDSGTASNLIWVCRECHDWIERHRDSAVANGWVITHGMERPQTIPLLYLGNWMYLTDSGQVKQFLETPWKDDDAAGR